ncbi:putative disease resistance protein RGA3 [Pistacia vera]|uniref:putative disease resistance protein RGA3 n=1 Tax=Pistacia vera TaxID=55513 RepID=UPI001263C4BE|nr:putative disease resistance protein RGA3 [Pistacia vera]
MAYATVSRILEQLASISKQVKQQGEKLAVGVDKEVEMLRAKLGAIQAVLLDAEQRRWKDEAVSVWLGELKDTCYDLEDVLDEWKTALLKLQIEGDQENVHVPKKVPFFPFTCFNYKRVDLPHQIALKIKDITRNLVVIAEREVCFRLQFLTSEISETVSSIEVSDIYGRDIEKNAIVEEKNAIVLRKLLEGGEQVRNLHIISIVGMGGTGKTFLARSAYNDCQIGKNFDAKIWVDVSNDFDMLAVGKTIVQTIKGSAPEVVELDSLLNMIRENIVGKKFLLVLDDVWTEDYSNWDPFYHCLKNGLHGSKILITTRRETVARMMDSTDTITINELDNEECWELFRKIAFSGRTREESENLEEIGRKIAGKCKGLPLAVRNIGGILRFKKHREEWLRILDSELWELTEFNILPSLLLSYNDMPSTIKQCFSYCAIFPEDYRIDKEQLIKLWMAQGFLGLENNMEMERVGEEYFNDLVERSILLVNTSSYCMHDLVHDLACFIRKKELLILEVNALENPSINLSLYHLTLILGVGASFPPSKFSSMKSLRSLLILYGVTNYQSMNEIMPRLFGELTRLRALDVSGKIWYENMVLDIPKEIGKLIYLRYLNLSLLKIKELPKELCELYNLQTLELRGCADLKSLPQGMGKLINLRHLVNEGTSLTYMPTGIERLTCLRTLSEFVVSGDDNGDKACTLESLANMTHLRGSLRIKMLGNWIEVNVAKKAELRNKDLLFLNLNFEKDAEEERANLDREGNRMDKDELVLDVLQPPLSLERLERLHSTEVMCSPIGLCH